MRPINRIPLIGRPGDYVTYQASAPLATHWRKASCAEIDCGAWRHGWRLRVENLTSELLHAATTSGRHYRHEQIAADENWLIFEAGQPCFQTSEHRTPLERDPIFQLRQGDGRLLHPGVQTFTRLEDWQGHFAEHQNRLVDQRNQFG